MKTSPLSRLQQFIRDYPVQGWLLQIAFLTAFYLVLGAIYYVLRHERFKPGILFLVVGLVLFPPTRHLERRLSDEGRREHPVSAEQEAAVGKISVTLALLSVWALGIAIFGRRFGLGIHDAEAFALLVFFSFSVLLALALGYAVQHTSWARRALFSWLGGLTLLILATALLGPGMHHSE